MYRVEEYRGDAKLLAPIAECWREEAKGGPFGLEVEVGPHLKDLQRLIDSDSAALLILVLNDKSEQEVHEITLPGGLECKELDDLYGGGKVAVRDGKVTVRVGKSKARVYMKPGTVAAAKTQ